MIRGFVFLTLLASPIVSAFDVYANYPTQLLSLYLRGSSCGLNWDTGIKMNQLSDETWTVSIDCNETETNIELKVLVNDKTWMLGSNHHADTGNTTTTNIFPWFYTYQGTLQLVDNVYSNELNNSRNIMYYLPPSYTENTLKTYNNLLIMHDGQNLFLKSLAYGGNPWYCQDSLDESIIGGETDEVIIAGAYNTDDRINEYTYIYDPSEDAGGLGDLYLDWLESTLIPLTFETFPRINQDIQGYGKTLGILGSSLGGIISCYAGWTRPNVYGKVGCMSSSFWWDSNDYQNNIIPNKTYVDAMSQPLLPIFYMDSGTGSIGEIECTEYTSNIYDQMINNQPNFIENEQVFKYVDQGGIHSETSWGPRFHIPMADLYPPDKV